MQLLDRYLTAVKFWLPKKQREDIAAELAANLQSEIDDRVAELGRPLTDDEIARSSSSTARRFSSPRVINRKTAPSLSGDSSSVRSFFRSIGPR